MWSVVWAPGWPQSPQTSDSAKVNARLVLYCRSAVPVLPLGLVPGVLTMDVMMPLVASVSR
jgi:hypothetical protein